MDAGYSFGPSIADRRDRAKRAAADLAADMSRHLNVMIDPEALQAYIVQRFHIVSPLSHTIHNGA